MTHFGSVRMADAPRRRIHFRGPLLATLLHVQNDEPEILYRSNLRKGLRQMSARIRGIGGILQHKRDTRPSMVE
jgi:hypothetical protein